MFWHSFRVLEDIHPMLQPHKVVSHEKRMKNAGSPWLAMKNAWFLVVAMQIILCLGLEKRSEKLHIFVYKHIERHGMGFTS